MANYMCWKSVPPKTALLIITLLTKELFRLCPRGLVCDNVISGASFQLFSCCVLDTFLIIFLIMCLWGLSGYECFIYLKMMAFLVSHVTNYKISLNLIFFLTWMSAWLCLNLQFKGTALGEKVLEAGIKLLTRQLESKVNNKKETKKSDANTKVISYS